MAIISLALMTTGLLIEKFISGEPLRILNYDAEQYMYGLLLGALNMAGLLAKIVAYQNERSGFITMLAYVGLFYAVLGDHFIFHAEFSLLMLLGILVILTLNIALVCLKIKAE